MKSQARPAPLPTPSQTVGPFFHPTLLRGDAQIIELITPAQVDRAIIIHGHVVDGESNPVPDAAIELWQANEHGQYAVPEQFRSDSSESRFTGYGRAGTDDNGYYRFLTVKPGPVPFDSERMQAPHILVTMYARGLLNHLVTRIYFEDERKLNDVDPILEKVPDERRGTVIAKREADEGDRPCYRFDIVLQGENETAFFNV